MIIDEEDLLLALRDYVRANVNTHITALNAKKTDFNIETIVDQPEFFVIAAELGDLPNRNFFNFAFNGEIQTQSYHKMVKLIIPMTVEYVFLANPGERTFRESLRYMIALRSTILNFASSIMEIDDVQVTTSRPVAAILDGRTYLVSGVGLTVTKA